MGKIVMCSYRSNYFKYRIDSIVNVDCKFVSVISVLNDIEEGFLLISSSFN